MTMESARLARKVHPYMETPFLRVFTLDHGSAIAGSTSERTISMRDAMLIQLRTSSIHVAGRSAVNRADARNRIRIYTLISFPQPCSGLCPRYNPLFPPD